MNKRKFNVNFKFYILCVVEVDEEFRHHMLNLFNFLTNPSKIVIKKIGGKEQTCRDLCNYMEVFATALNSDKSLDDPQSFILVMLSFPA